MSVTVGAEEGATSAVSADAATDAGSVPWLDAEESAAWRAFINGSQRLLGTLNRELLDATGLSLDDYRILVNLSESPTGALRMSELAEGIVSSRSRLTHQVRRLEAQQLVRRQDCPSDGRGVLAVLTDHGRATLTEVAPGHVASVRKHLVDQLSPAERRVLMGVFSRVDKALQDN
ncbi:MAG: MarR family transcriptional regulator [Mycobacteriaceae bacterium]